uniref:Uncharacterized protein n=2 Tax=Romanomermis culicivorax TaxID=13658 RepID=A0A915JYZ7_ROMCU
MESWPSAENPVQRCRIVGPNIRFRGPEIGDRFPKRRPNLRRRFEPGRNRNRDRGRAGRQCLPRFRRIRTGTTGVGYRQFRHQNFYLQRDLSFFVRR